MTAALGERPAATLEDLRAFFNERSGDYRAPEYRSIVYMTLSEANLADPHAISAQEVQAAYEAELDQLTSAGERNITQLAVPGCKPGQPGARLRLAAGETVADLQGDETLDFTVSELGAVQRSAILDEAAGDAAFALECSRARPRLSMGASAA
jgi:peptidyl-prolyl cis-trans isomerase D